MKEFIPSPMAHNESLRIEALRSYAVDYLLDEKQFNDIARLAADVCHTSIALITFVDETINYFKSEIGFGMRTAQRDDSFCQYTIQGHDVYEVEDAVQHDNFQNNLYVKGHPHLRYYAGIPLLTATGYALGTLCVLDTRPRKLTDAQRTSLATLGQVVVSFLELKKSQDKAQHAQQKAEDALLVKSDFISMISHEIRTPLNGISGIAHLLLNENLNHKQRAYATALQNSSDALMTLVSDILEYSEIKRGEVNFRKTTYNLHELLLEIVSNNSPAAENKKLKLSLNLDNNVPTMIVGDAQRLSQVLSNLLNNAVKFTAQGGVSILVQNIPSDPVTRLKFTVKDTGVGIPKEQLAMLFDWFTQADCSTTRKFGGSGLGLAICKRLLELQDSSLYVKSALGVGSEFSFVLNIDLAKKEIAPTTKRIQKEEKSLEGMRILLVEDNDLNILIASSILKRWDAAVTIAKNGLEAVEAVQRQAFDVILTDIQMPEMNGVVASEHIRSLGFSSEDLPIIALSASPLSNADELTSKGIINGFISKPFKPSALYDTLNQFK